jgi:hypothetical protein
MGDVEKLTNGTTGGPVFVYVQDPWNWMEMMQTPG